VIVFTGIWAWTSFGPHTASPKENWTRIENIWQPKRDADLKALSTAVAANNFYATISGYKSLGADTKGWMDELDTIKGWVDASASQDPAAVPANDAVAQLVQDGNAEVTLLNQAAAAKTPDDLLALKDQIAVADQAFVDDTAMVSQVVSGIVPAASGAPTLALPSGSLAPSASPVASGAAPSASAGESIVPTSVPSAAPTPALSASALPS
jgi:hypothetical protein